jgi:endonuclease/exonuclease/phosphatase family metal-dependent hydrolase/dienelactone hydrolase
MYRLAHHISIFMVTLIAMCLVMVGQIHAQEISETYEAQLRILTYNIHHGRGVDGTLDLERIAKVIRSASPDIVALQEVDKDVTRSQSIDQPALLADQTDMQVVFGGNLPLQGGQYGNAILSKLPILIDRNHLLPTIDNGEQRGVLVAQLRKGREVISILATHLDHRRDDRERLASATAINLIANDLGSSPTILAGDLNATRDSSVLKRLAPNWSIAGELEQPTIPVAKPERQIDFVLTHPTDRWSVVKTEVIDEQIASDHRPLLAVLQLSNDNSIAEKVLHEDVLHVGGDDGKSAVATTPGRWESRRQSIRQSMQSIMGWLPTLPDRSPPIIDEIEEVDCGTYVRKKITYRSQPSGDTPAYLCIPKGIEDGKRFPAVLCLHPTDNKVGHDVVVGLGGKPNRQYASELAERGYVTLAPSYPLLANYQPDLAALGWESGSLKAIWDNIRGIDLLQSLPQVDADSIGAIGHSLGGHNSIYTAVLDPRIDAVVTSCGFDSYADYYDGNPAVWEPGKGWTQLRYIPRLADFKGRLNEIPFDFDELLASIAPRHILVVAPLHDSNFRAASVDRMTSEARKVFALHGHPERLEVIHPDCEHDFPDEMREQAYRLFDRVLKRTEE